MQSSAKSAQSSSISCPARQNQNGMISWDMRREMQIFHANRRRLRFSFRIIIKI
jgi:hypothetical protein